MARLPVSGSDNGVWGDVLNDFLLVAHTTGGAIKANAVDSSAIQDNSISGAKLQDSSVTNAKLNVGSGSDGQVLVKNSGAAGGFEWGNGSGAPDATAGTKGILQLTGDLGGTATSPTVPGLATKANTSTTISAGTGLTGGGDLSTNRTLNVSYGTTAGTAAQGNDSRITGAVQSTVVDAKGDIIAATAADTVARLAVGTNGQVLTSDSTQATGLRWATPSAGGGDSLDASAVRYGCKALTATPHDIAHADPQFLEMASQRLYAYWLPLPVGTTVTGVRLPIAAVVTGAGNLFFTVYQEDLSQLGATGDVRTAFAAGAGSTWRNAALGVPAVTTGSGVWVTALSDIASGALSVVFSNVTNQPSWLPNPADRKTALRVEGVASPPGTLDLSGAVDYIDFLIGVY